MAVFNNKKLVKLEEKLVIFHVQKINNLIFVSSEIGFCGTEEIEIPPSFRHISK